MTRDTRVTLTRVTAQGHDHQMSDVENFISGYEFHYDIKHYWLILTGTCISIASGHISSASKRLTLAQWLAHDPKIQTCTTLRILDITQPTAVIMNN